MEKIIKISWHIIQNYVESNYFKMRKVACYHISKSKRLKNYAFDGLSGVSLFTIFPQVHNILPISNGLKTETKLMEETFRRGQKTCCQKKIKHTVYMQNLPRF